MAPHSLLSAAYFAAAAVALAGCDAGKDLLAKGAEAEAASDFAQARTLYQDACAKSPALCPIAIRQAEQVTLKEAWKAIAAGEYDKAKTVVEGAKAATDPAVKGAAEAASQDVEYAQGLAWEEASALADKEQALPKIEAIADLGIPVSVPAREWLAKNRPAILLGRVKVACKAGGQGSCAEAGKALATLYASNPENAEAQALVAADYQRVYPLLKQAENLLIQRVEVYDKDQIVQICMSKSSEPSDQAHTACESQVVGDRNLPSVGFLEGAWKKKLDEIKDPLFVQGLDARFKRAGSTGELDPAQWLKPAGSK
jgi:hypothetical protein